MGGGATAGSPPAADAQARSGSLAERMSGMLFGPPAPAPAADNSGAIPASTTESIDCPPITVRRGTATITAYGPGDQVATNVRYQLSVGELARECAVMGVTIAAKLGFEGRLVLGPQGRPGRVTVPIRFALVREGPEPRTVWTQLYQVPVDIEPGQSHIRFVHVDDNVAFPKPSSTELDAYIFYVGFDQLALRDQPRGRRQRGR